MSLSWIYQEEPIEFLFSMIRFYLVIYLMFINLLVLWYLLTKIKIRDAHRLQTRLKNPPKRELTALERIEERNRILENRRRLKYK